MKIREDLMISGNKFPNFERPDQDGIIRTLEDLMRGCAHNPCLLAGGILTEGCSPVGELCKRPAARIGGQLL